MFVISLLFFLFRSSAGVIYQLNDSDYALMPPVFHLDRFEACYEDREALYCTLEFALVSDEPSSLLSMIQEYSAHKTHYNHTLLRHGICITDTCKKFYKLSNVDLGLVLEACLNETFYYKHKLKVRVSDGYDCSKREKYLKIDNLDITVGAICIIILLANIIGSICDYFFEKGKMYAGLRFLYCFSLFRNWKKLVAHPSADGDPRLQRLKSIHGIRALTMFLVIIGHSLITVIFLIENTKYAENLYLIRPCHIIMNGPLIMQTFLVISSFLLVYCWLIHAEKTDPSWKMLPKQILMRWLRLTPAYAVILALTLTWFGRISSGPYWKKMVYNEMSKCRQEWWMNLLYINNYFDRTECMNQTWYLATDTQLYYMAVIIFLACRTPRSRKVVLSLLFVAGIIIPTVQTYWMNLDGLLLITPETVLSLFVNDLVYNEIYKRAHSNLTGYAIGMALGYIVYEVQKTGDLRNVQKYRYVYWALFPLGCMCCLSAFVFYEDRPPPSLFINLLYAALLKPAFGILIACCIFGAIFQVEGVYRGILEWHGWTTPSRLSFSAYLLHMALIRNINGMRTTTIQSSVEESMFQGFVLVLVTYTAAFFLYLLVEGPFANLVRECLFKPETKDEKESKEENTNSKEIAEPVDKTTEEISNKY